MIIVADITDDPSDETSGMNYPFGLWLFGATIAKITGLPPITADFFFITLFLLILVGYFLSIFQYMAGIQRAKNMCRTVFDLNAPDFTNQYELRANVFILPFLFIMFYFIFKEPVNWKLLPIVWLSIFIIIISHTGTFVFLLGFSMAFFLLYCLFWGKFSKPLYIAIVSTFSSMFFHFRWFPHIANQYLYTIQEIFITW